MFRFDDNLRVYLHRDPVDFRYGMTSLSILVEQVMHRKRLICTVPPPCVEDAIIACDGHE